MNDENKLLRRLKTTDMMFKNNFEKITIQSLKNFFDLDNKVFVYILICNALDVEITSKICRLFKFLKSYKNCFNFKNTKNLSEHENEDHVIDFVSGAKSWYKSFYIFSETELNVLRNYLLKI